jgi:hypothetical protein
MSEANKKHMQLEAILAKLLADHPSTGIGVLFDVRDGKASLFEVEALSHPSVGLAVENGQLTALGQEVADLAEKKIKKAIGGQQTSLLSRNVDQDLTNRDQEQKHKHDIQKNIESVIKVSERQLTGGAQQIKSELSRIKVPSRVKRSGPEIG